MKASLNDFMLRALFGRHCIADMQSTGVLRTPAVSAKERSEQDLFAPIPDRIRSASLQMQGVYRRLFVFENLIRSFIDERLTETSGDDWFDKIATREMKDKYKNRKEKEEKNQWHAGREAHPIYYLDFGDLGLLIINQWDVFKDFFDSQTWVQSRMQEAERSRNVIAHTNVLPAEEAQRLEMYLRDWIKQIG
jgi:hypothetical protein